VVKGSDARRRIRALARSGRIFVDDHAWDAMERRCMPFADLRHALEHAESVECKRTVAGVLLDEIPMVTCYG